MLSVATILKEIEGGSDIVTLAPVMRRLLALKGVNGDDSKLFLELAKSDPALSVRLLRAANSPGEYDGPVKTVEEAIERLGFQNARHLALTTNFLDDGKRDGDPVADHHRLQWLWERSICTAVAAEIFSHRLGLANSAQSRTVGLLLDIGILFLLNSFPKDYATLIDRWQSEGGLLTDLENDLLGVDHCSVGRQLARTWNLGEEVENAIDYHNRTSEECDGSSECAVYQLANLAAAVLFEDRHITGLERAIRFGKEKLGIERAAFVDELQRITLIADGAAMRISLPTGPTISYIELLRNVNTELGRATLSYEQMVRELEIAMKKAETLAQKLEEVNHKLRDVANYDTLTRIHNRRFFDEFLNWNFNRSQRYNTTLGCMMLDIDHFKNVNDTYGHLTGDRVLQGVAEALKNNLRNTDIVARYGGEEFVVLLPETKPEAVHMTATKLNKAVRKIRYELPEGELGVTISIGYVVYTPAEMPGIAGPTDLVKLADQNMYMAKQAGRDRVYPDPHPHHRAAKGT